MAMPSNLDDNKQYNLELNTVIKLSEHVTLIPGLPMVVKGKVIKTLPPEAIVSAVEVGA